jgi:hypothetical protein
MKLGRLRGLAIVAAASMAAGVLAQDSATSGQESTSGGATSGGATGTSTTAGKKHEVSGLVQSIGKKALTLSTGEQVRLTDQTQFLRNGQTISSSEIKRGEQVRASYEPRGGLAYATTIEVTEGGGQPKGGGQPPGGAAQPGGGGQGGGGMQQGGGGQGGGAGDGGY